ncbi:tannase/feruloyl esterase family alpha/beta hydrolase [Dyadobacter luticola]|uniref:Tannase/feruloyl esterase family alpha/beta hydrolase n=1 Tax=Dyadobacter luticola TaxID=1979387 RepID=A0A5R9L477_9BACT|nr:tannase/feruloyl esterase family alpha/beta hydrolase [Dyadobacter luticola]TLV03353.1 tannase/feruloyl esterase family alpha/beta hydrolase [Dyadobacter luticola]
MFLSKPTFWLALSLTICLNFLLSAFHVAFGQANPDCNCAELAKATFPNTTITTAECIPAGTFTLPGSTQSFSDLPAFCRVASTLKPTSDSNIRIEVWLPQSGWNGRFLGTGNGGGAGGIAYGALVNGLKKGFAVANTDMGTSPGANEIVGHPEKWADFGYRATHEMTVTGKLITEAHYKQRIKHAYFTGCSTGGQQASMESQRYPDDYDGILAGAPANNRTHLHTMFVWNLWVTNDAAGSAFLPKEKIALITNAVVKACAGKDGGAPGDHFLTDPSACHFDPKTLPKCPAGTDDGTCLTAPQLAALKKLYQGPVNPRTGERIYTPIPLGSENSSAGVEMQQNPDASPKSLFYQYKWAFGNEFDYKTFDFDKDQDKLDAQLGQILNANNTDLSPLKRRGGKILMYAGMADPLVPYQDAVSYYDRVVAAQGSLEKTQDFFRFFLVPGMAHCGGGPGLNDCGDMLSALIKWEEEGTAPQQLMGTAFVDANPKNAVRFKRPLFPYPELPVYQGGDVNSPESFKGVAFPDRKVVAPAARYLK